MAVGRGVVFMYLVRGPPWLLMQIEKADDIRKFGLMLDVLDTS